MLVLSKMWFKSGILLLIYLNLRVCLGSSCVKEKTCKGCINLAGERCVWCPSKHLPKDEPRCRSQSHVKEKWCTGEAYDPPSWDDYRKNSNKSDLQFTPTYLKVKLRPSVPINFTINYKPAQDQPLDVYLLLDNSGSMEALRGELSRIAVKLQENLNNISNNVYMGVGSFIEKPAKPYTVYKASPYSFKNHLSLTPNMSLLKQTLIEMKPGKNADTLEAGLDALMQVMVCKEIGWRPKARRMIVYASDESFHATGDGKMVGAFKPNDMKCHLKNNIHSSSLEYDYPSPGRLNKVANDKDITTIFVLKQNLGKTKDQKKATIRPYKRLIKQIKNAQFSTIDSEADIAKIIIASYKKLKRSVIINHSSLSNVNLILNPDCTKNKNDVCQLGLKESITINATISLNSCSMNSSYENKMIVGAMALQSNESLNIEIEELCNCECENQGNASAPECNNHGTYQCGICACDKDRIGDTCECAKTKVDSSNKTCHEEFCNGQGQCKCGQCHCYPGFGGRDCELSDTACKLVDGKLCAGHGVCVKSKCICDKDWTISDDCSCSSKTSSCDNPESTDNELCSNNGDCICDKCKCKNEYSGKYCEYCMECEKKTCKDLKDYAQCVFSKNKNICDEKFNNLPKDIDSAIVREKESDSDQMQVPLTCKITYDNGSAINFQYGLDPSTKKWILEVNKELENPPSAKIWVLIGAVIGSILLGGLLMLFIWKCTVDYLDKKEFDKFEAEAKSAGFNVTLENPCYVEPVVVFRNPNYNARND